MTPQYFNFSYSYFYIYFLIFPYSIPYRMTLIFPLKMVHFGTVGDGSEDGPHVPFFSLRVAGILGQVL